ncbi:MAG: ATP phosphoribosyltransferase regulatory subunit [Gammaproteobacteria bacterium]|nr:ATP phosphoribosyltransferase regulatory subunit [Gammaproteobacteria bacterium]
MTIVDRWLLPDGVEEILPPDASHLERIRRQLIDLYTSWGYEYVIPPMIEFLESLLTGTGKDLDYKTFKVTDQISGRMMGIRADMTPQVARMDAHSLGREGPARFCYAGTVLHARADNQTASRSPIRVGAELFGVPAPEGEFEIICLMIESLMSSGVDKIQLELGDVGIFRHLVAAAGLTDEQEIRLFEPIQRKAPADLKLIVARLGLDETLAARIIALPQMMGNADALERAVALLGDNEILAARLDGLQHLSRRIRQRYPSLEIFYDLSELRGYTYHTGIVFAAYNCEGGQLLARGGRYDHIGEVFGRARVATGFDVDLKSLSGQLQPGKPARVVAVTEVLDDRQQLDMIARLREQGYVVIEGDTGAINVHHRLVYRAGKWQLA